MTRAAVLLLMLLLAACGEEEPPKRTVNGMIESPLQNTVILHSTSILQNQYLALTDV
jgi:hypothetical protein